MQGATAVTEVTAALQELDAQPGGRRHRHRPRRRLGRGPAAVQQRGPGAGRRGRAHPGGLARSGTTSTPRCSTSSPTCAPPPPPTRPRRSCPTPQAERHRPSPAARPRAARARTGGCTTSGGASSRCAPARCWPDPARDRARAARGRHGAATARAPPGRRPSCTAPATRSRTCGAQVRTLSPLSTLDRGYAVVQQGDGASSATRPTLEVDELLRVRVARGDFACPHARVRLLGPWPRADTAARRPTTSRPQPCQRHLPADDAATPTWRTLDLRAGPRRAGRRRRPASRAARWVSRRAWACGSAARRWPRTAHRGWTSAEAAAHPGRRDGRRLATRCSRRDRSGQPVGDGTGGLGERRQLVEGAGAGDERGELAGRPRARCDAGCSAPWRCARRCPRCVPATCTLAGLRGAVGLRRRPTRRWRPWSARWRRSCPTGSGSRRARSSARRWSARSARWWSSSPRAGLGPRRSASRCPWPPRRAAPCDVDRRLRRRC